MEYAEFQELKTQRLLLRKLRREDVQGYYRFAGSETVTRFMLWKAHRDVNESAASLEKALRHYEEGKFYRWAIAEREDDRVMGIIDLLGFDEEENACSFAYMIAEEYWGRGYGREALKAVLAFAFEVLKVDAVEADHFAENAASGAVMGRCGMQYCGRVSGKYEKGGILYDAIQYRITREDWGNGNS